MFFDRIQFCLDISSFFQYFLPITLKDRALLESNLSVREMPRQMAQGECILTLGH